MLPYINLPSVKLLELWNDTPIKYGFAVTSTAYRGLRFKQIQDTYALSCSFQNTDATSGHKDHMILRCAYYAYISVWRRYNSYAGLSITGSAASVGYLI